MLISVEEAECVLRHSLATGLTERVVLADAGGRVLREPVRTPRPLPPFDRVMMDGIAVSGAAFSGGRRCFEIEGTLHAGEHGVRLGGESNCWRVMTGAVCPDGATLVIPREVVALDGNRAEVDSAFVPPENAHIHATGSDAAAGTVLLEPGRRLDGAALGVVASCNCASIEVARRPRIALVSTGDELIEPGQRLEPHQIPRSNAYALTALLARHAEIELESHHFADRRVSLNDGLAALIERVDFLVCSGGVSMGDRDYLPGVLAELGVGKRFHGVAQRPGKPLWFGARKNGAAVFALPGNPVSTLVSARRYVVPAIAQWMGQGVLPAHPMPLASDFEFRPPLTCFLPVRHLGTTVQPAPVGSSGDFVNLLKSDGFVELSADQSEFPVGFAAPYFPW